MNSSNNDKKEFQELLQQVLDGSLTPEEATRLQELCKDHPERLEEIVDHTLITSLLVDEGGTQAIGDMVDFVSASNSQLSFSKPQNRHLQSIIKYTSLAAAIMIAFSIWYLMPHHEEEPTEINEVSSNSIAHLETDLDIQWLGERQPIKGAALHPGILEFGEGVAKLEFYSGAKVIVEGPAKFELISPYLAHCFYGKIRAHVPHQAHGFTITTPAYKLVDLGTEFGMNVSASGKGQVHVFDGEIELHASNQKTRSVFGGQTYEVNTLGISAPTQNAPSNFLSFSDVQLRSDQNANLKLESWKKWNSQLTRNPALISKFDFENKHLEEGALVGCEWTQGRWPAKGALGFSRTGDRIRINIPGEFSEITLMSWIRIDALPKRHQALLLTDLHELDRVHWQISNTGKLCLGTKLMPKEDNKWRGSDTPIIFTPQQLGIWNHICTTFNLKKGNVCHYLNGKKVSEHTSKFSRPLKIGAGDIGNWSVPTKGPSGPRALRNFIGRIDELTILKTTLSAIEVEQHYQSFRP